MTRVTDTDFEEALKLARPNWSLLESRWAARLEKRRVRAWCHTHECEFLLNVRQRTALYGCRECALDKVREKLRVPDSVYIKRLKTAFPHIRIVGPRHPSKPIFPARCLKHKIDFSLHLWNALSHKTLTPYVSCPGCKAENNSCNWSLASQRWLALVEANTGLPDLQKASTTGEHYIPGVGRVDGYSAIANSVFEFLGDDFHGRTRSRSASKAIKSWLGKSSVQLKAETLKRLDALLLRGYAVFYVWESDMSQVKENVFIVRQYTAHAESCKLKGGLQYLSDDELKEQRTGAHKRR